MSGMQVPSKNYERAVQVYEDGGMDAVFQAVDDGFITCDNYRHCVPCECQTPHEGSTCLVCGTDNPMQPPAPGKDLVHTIRFERATDCYLWLAENDIHQPVTLTIHLGE